MRFHVGLHVRKALLLSSADICILYPEELRGNHKHCVNTMNTVLFKLRGFGCG